MAPSSSPTVATRNGPTRCDEASAGCAEHDEGQGEEGDPEVGDPLVRVEVVEDDRPQRVERADHQEHRPAQQDGAGERSDAAAGRARGAAAGGSGDSVDPGVAHDERHRHERRRGDGQERRRDPERADQQRRQGRPGGEPGDVGGEQPPDVVADAVRFGDDHDALDRRHGHPDPDAHHEAAERGTARTPSAAASSSSPATLSADAAVDEEAGMARGRRTGR